MFGVSDHHSNNLHNLMALNYIIQYHMVCINYIPEEVCPEDGDRIPPVAGENED